MLMRIVGCALVAGGIAGGVGALLQQALVVPLILEAEVFEAGAAAHVHADGMAHFHDGAATAGPGRVLTTVVMTVAVNVGFAFLLLAAFHALDARPSLREGLVWGAAGFVAFMLAPAAVVVILLSFGVGPLDPWQTLLGGLAGFGLFLLLAILGRGALGAGDVKLAGVIGLMTGYPTVWTALAQSKDGLRS